MYVFYLNAIERKRHRFKKLLTRFHRRNNESGVVGVNGGSVNIYVKFTEYIVNLSSRLFYSLHLTPQRKNFDIIISLCRCSMKEACKQEMYILCNAFVRFYMVS